MRIDLKTAARAVNKAAYSAEFLATLTCVASASNRNVNLDTSVVHCISGLEPGVKYLQGSHINALIQAALTAYTQHHGLVLSPDVIWNTIASGAAVHIKQNAEALRGKFVKHQGKAFLEVEADWMVIQTGAAAMADKPHMEAWAAVASEFPNLMAEHMADPSVLGAFLADFSTTTLPSRIASAITLMDSMSAYFDYGMSTRCGIAYVQLLGTKEDWQSVGAKAALLLGMTGQKEWLAELQPVLGKFAEAFQGGADQGFWGDLFKYHCPGSGNPWVTGWLNVFYPFLVNPTRVNPLVAYSAASTRDWDNQMRRGGCPSVGQFPQYINSATVKWAYYPSQLTLDMQLRAGAMQVAVVHEGMALEPRCAWFVVEKGRKNMDAADPFGMDDETT